MKIALLLLLVHFGLSETLLAADPSVVAYLEGNILYSFSKAIFPPTVKTADDKPLGDILEARYCRTTNSKGIFVVAVQTVRRDHRPLLGPEACKKPLSVLAEANADFGIDSIGNVEVSWNDWELEFQPLEFLRAKNAKVDQNTVKSLTQYKRKLSTRNLSIDQRKPAEQYSLAFQFKPVGVLIGIFDSDVDFFKDWGDVSFAKLETTYPTNFVVLVRHAFVKNKLLGGNTELDLTNEFKVNKLDYNGDTAKLLVTGEMINGSVSGKGEIELQGVPLKLTGVKLMPNLERCGEPFSAAIDCNLRNGVQRFAAKQIEALILQKIAKSHLKFNFGRQLIFSERPVNVKGTVMDGLSTDSHLTLFGSALFEENQ